jgi:hypothetical protein
VTNNQNIQGAQKTKLLKKINDQKSNEQMNWTELVQRNKSKWGKNTQIPGHKEMQIKITLRFHLVPVRIAIIKNTNNGSIQVYRAEKKSN